MSVGAVARPMVKRTDVSVKVDAEAVRIARNVATYRGLSLAEYLSQLVLDAAARDWREILEQEQKALPSKPSKGKEGPSK